MKRLQRGKAVHEIAAALEAEGKPLDAISLLIRRDCQTEAAQILERADGMQLIYRTRLDEFQKAILQFSPEMMATSETVLFAVTRTLLKQGDVQRVRHLVAKYQGVDYLDPLKVLAPGSRFSTAACSFRLLMMIGEDLTPSDTILNQLGAFMAGYPVGQFSRWAGFYNAILELEIRRRNFREAEAAAARALIYLQKMGKEPLLEFFIHIHQTVLRLTHGDVCEARRAAETARERLQSAPHAAGNEWRILRLAEACLAYEAEQPADLLAFVQDEFSDFAAAEIWPSLMQFALHYASQVMMDHSPLTVRPGFLDGLCLHLSERLHFNAMMEIRTAIAYQNVNRWAEAEAVLSAIRVPKGRNWVESAEESLTLLTRRDEIGYAMAWLRSASRLRHSRPHLERQLTALTANPNVTNRERIALSIWQAYIAQQRRDLAQARQHLMTALLSVSRLGCNGVLSEEKYFVAPLLGDQRIASYIEANRDVAGAVTLFARRLESPQARARLAGLSMREAQMLDLLANGLSNKWIARTLEVSEVTVKFHLSNLYRKLGCSTRAQAIRIAGERAWI